MKTILTNGTVRGVVAVLAMMVLLAMVPSEAHAQSEGEASVPQWIRRTGTHRIAGYVTLGLATTTAALGILGSEYHYLAAGATFGSSVVSLSLGSIAYGEQLDRYWPHAVLAGLATAGFATNLFFLEGGSQEHIITGAASVGTLFAAYGTILWLTR